MRIISHIYSPTTGGVPPTYGGGTPAFVNYSGLSLKLGISKGGSAVTNIVTTTDLHSLDPSTVNSTPIVYGKYHITLTNFQYIETFTSPPDSDVLVLSNAYLIYDITVKTNGENKTVTWEKFNLHTEISKEGYESLANSIELYNYDIGNEAAEDVSGNTNFNYYLRVSSDVSQPYIETFTLRVPFTNDIMFYNMVSGTDSVVFYNNDTDEVIGNGRFGSINNETLFNLRSVSTIGEASFEASSTVEPIIWLPTVTTTTSTPESCEGCINTESSSTVSATVDYSAVSTFRIEGTPVFLTEVLNEVIAFELYNSDGQLISNQENEFPITFEDWNDSPSSFLVPIPFEFTPSTLGDNVVKVSNRFSTSFSTLVDGISVVTDSDILVCSDAVDMPTCNWWTASEGESCGKYTFKNCSNLPVNMTLQVLQDDKTFADISTVTVEPFTSTTIELSEDGIYIIKVPSRTEDDVFEYYTIANFCAIEDCWLKFLNKVICTKPNDNCSTEDYYDFNAFMINAHSLFMMLNDEFAFNFVYTTIDDERIKNLFDMKTLIDRMKEFCGSAATPCAPCNADL